jgi:HEAT repeat protein
MADENVAKQIISLANDGGAPPARRTGAAIALGLIEKPSSPIEISSALQGLLNVAESPEIRIAAAEALGRAGAKDAVPNLITKVRDPEPDVIVAVLRALAKVKSVDAVPAIAELLKTGGPVIADPAKMTKREEALEFAAQALGDVGSPEGIQPLLYARAQARSTVWKTAQRSIERIIQADRGGLGRLIEWCMGENVVKIQPLPYLRATACYAIADLPAELRGNEGRDALVSRILDRNYPKEMHDFTHEVRKAAAIGLAKIGDEKGAAALIACLQDGTGIPRDAKLTIGKDIRLIAAEGLDKMVTGDKPMKWEPPAADAKYEDIMKRWSQLVTDWETWLAKKEGRPTAAAPAPAPGATAPPP